MSTDVLFKDVRKSIEDALYMRHKELGINKTVTLVEGFINLPFSKEITDYMMVGGPSIPSVMVVENHTGKIHLFSYSALMKIK